MIESIKTATDSIFPVVVDIRRHIRMYPELAHQEYETREFIIDQLSVMGAKHIERIGTTSVCVVFGSGEMPALAFRSDIDALPILEANNVPYRSQREGVMHACGHDGHTAILLGLAMLLQKYEALLPRPVKLIFQQAEESTESGAPLLLKGTVLQDPPVGAIYGYHLWPHLPTGTIGLCDAILMPRTDLLTFQVHGGITYLPGTPRDSNPIRITLLLLNRLNQLIEEKTFPWNQVQLAFRTIKGGVLPNQSKGQVEVISTLRSTSDDGRDQVLNLIKRIVAELEVEQQVSLSIDVLPEVRPLLANTPRCVNFIRDAASDVETINHIVEVTDPLRNSEDFGHYLKYTDGAYVLIGCGWHNREVIPLHTPTYDFNETALSIGIALLANLIFLQQ